MTNPQGNAWNLAYDPKGNLTSVTARYAYDLADRLVSWTSPFADPGAGEALSVAYDLDDGSNIVGATTTGATSETVVATIAAAYPTGAWSSARPPPGGPRPPRPSPTTAWARRSCARATTSTPPRPTTRGATPPRWTTARGRTTT
jgi:hypothetical protein